MTGQRLPVTSHVRSVDLSGSEAIENFGDGADLAVRWIKLYQGLGLTRPRAHDWGLEGGGPA
jgi:hypothetical protein